MSLFPSSILSPIKGLILMQSSLSSQSPLAQFLRHKRYSSDVSGKFTILNPQIFGSKVVVVFQSLSCQSPLSLSPIKLFATPQPVTPGVPVLCYRPESAQIHVHPVTDAI